jgi:hypothetical protein
MYALSTSGWGLVKGSIKGPASPRMRSLLHLKLSQIQQRHKRKEGRIG